MFRRFFCAFSLSIWLLPSILSSEDRASNWVIAETNSYTLITNANLRRSHETIEALHYLHQIFRERFAKSKDEDRLPLRHLIVLPRTERETRPLYPISPDGTPLAADGVYISSLYLPTILATASNGRKFNAIYHEYTHHLAEIYLGDLPAWANEGIAELFSSFSLKGPKIYIGAIPRDDASRANYRQSKIPWKDFFNQDNERLLASLGEHADRATAFYTQARLLAHFCYFSEEPGMFHAYLALAERNKRSSISEFDTRTTLGFSFEELDIALEKHRRKNGKKAHVLHRDDFEKPPLVAFESLSEETLEIYQSHVFAIGRQFESAETLLNRHDYRALTDSLWNTVSSELSILENGDISSSLSYSLQAYRLGSELPFDATLSALAEINRGEYKPNDLIERLKKAHASGERSAYLYEAYHQIIYSQNGYLNKEHADFLWEGLILHPKISYSSKIVELSRAR